jgi:hypothetical protein
LIHVQHEVCRRYDRKGPNELARVRGPQANDESPKGDIDHDQRDGHDKDEPEDRRNDDKDTDDLPKHLSEVTVTGIAGAADWLWTVYYLSFRSVTHAVFETLVVDLVPSTVFGKGEALHLGVYDLVHEVGFLPVVDALLVDLVVPTLV